MFQKQNAAVCMGWVRLVQWPLAGYMSQLSPENVPALTILIAAEKTTDNKRDKSQCCSNVFSLHKSSVGASVIGLVSENICLISIFRKSA